MVITRASKICQAEGIGSTQVTQLESLRACHEACSDPMMKTSLYKGKKTISEKNLGAYLIKKDIVVSASKNCRELYLGLQSGGENMPSTLDIMDVLEAVDISHLRKVLNLTVSRTDSSLSAFGVKALYQMVAKKYENACFATQVAAVTGAWIHRVLNGIRANEEVVEQAITTLKMKPHLTADITVVWICVKNLRQSYSIEGEVEDEGQAANVSEFLWEIPVVRF